VTSRPFLFMWQIVFCLVFLKGIFWFLLNQQKKRRHTGALFLVILVPIPLALFLAQRVGLNNTYIERCMIFGLPFFYLFLVLGLKSIRWTLLRRIITSCLIASTAYAAFILPKSGEQCTVFKPKPDWQSAARYIRLDHPSTGPCPPILCPRTHLELLYYAPDMPVRPWTSAEDLMKNKIKTFYFIKDIWWPETSDQILKSLAEDRRYTLLDMRTFKSLRIYKFTLTGPS